MSQSITNFTTGQTLTAAALNSAFAQSPTVASVQPAIAANPGSLLGGPTSTGGPPAPVTLGSGFSLPGNVLTYSGGGGGGGGAVSSVFGQTGAITAAQAYSALVGTTTGNTLADGGVVAANTAAIATKANIGAVRLVTSTLTDTVATTGSTLDNFIGWKNSTIGIKTETLGAGASNQSIKITDALGNAATSGNAIIINATGCTINGFPSFILNQNYQSVTLQWDNVSNWMAA